MKKTYLERIAALQSTIAAKRQRQQEIMTKALDDEGRSLDQSEAEEFDTLKAELKQLDADVVRLQDLHEADLLTAKDVGQQDDGNTGTVQQRQGAPAVLRQREPEQAFKGQNFTRYVIARAVARMDHESPIDIAAARWGKTSPKLVHAIKAAVAGGGTGAGEWGSELVTMEQYTADFIEFLYGMTVFDKLPLRRVPANVPIKGQDGAATGYWVGESKAIPVTSADFFNVSLTQLKVAAIAVVSNELLRTASPDAELLVRDALAQALAQRTDTTFLSAAAAVAGVSPAGVLNGVVGTAASGTTADDLRADIKTLYAPFIAAKNASGLSFVTTPSLAKSIELMRNAMGIREFPGAAMAGGTLEGDPMVSGDNVGAGNLILLKPSDIYRIADSGLDVRVSDVATVEQGTAPTGATDTPTAASEAITSMFQADSSAIRVIRRLNFAKRRANSVSLVTAAAYA